MNRCSLAYGTPPMIHRNHHDVPIPTLEDLITSANPTQISATNTFIALMTLTEVLGRALEYVYNLSSKDFLSSPSDLEHLLTSWEDSLDDSLRRLVIRGTGLTGPGAANLRLSYLSVKLLIRRYQLNHDRSALQIADVDSTYYLQTRRVAEEIVDFVRELDAPQCGDFWIPVNSFTLTSATTFLVRCALTSRRATSDPSLRLARSMIDALQNLRAKYSWDIADNCLANCGDLVEKIESFMAMTSPSTLEFDSAMLMDMDLTAINSFFSEYSTAAF
jgi:hypothetical protein